MDILIKMPIYLQTWKFMRKEVEHMIEFKLKSTDGSKIYYNFSGVGLYGIVVIDKETSEIAFVEVNGHYKNNEKEKAMLLYIAQKKIKSMNFPETCVYATH